MDANDRKLLDILQQNAKTSAQDMAEHIGSSTASVQRRLKTLRESGVIKKEVAILDQKKLGFGITAVVAVDRERLDQIDAFERKARQDRRITNFYCIAGDADFMIVVVAKNITDYEDFTHRFFFADKNVRNFRTSNVISTEKATLKLPIKFSQSGLSLLDVKSVILGSKCELARIRE